MSAATLTSKGQTTIPKDIRDSLGLQGQDRLEFTLLADGTVIMRAKKRQLADAFGMLHRPGKKAIAVEDMKPRG